MTKNPILSDMYRVKRGLAGYVSYLAACEMNESFSEYILYEPALRILTAQGWKVQCEYPCPGFPKPGAGDFKKLDFVCTGKNGSFAVEMKWARKVKPNVTLDVQKLQRYMAGIPGSRGFLCVFGRKSVIEPLELGAQGVAESGKPIYADFGVTRFGCRNYEVRVA